MQFVDLMEADIPSPEDPLVDSERSRLVKLVIDSLPGHLREILLLSYFQQMSYNQIAATLEIPLGTVKSRLHTAVAAFARAWKSARQEDEARDEVSEDPHCVPSGSYPVSDGPDRVPTGLHHVSEDNHSVSGDSDRVRDHGMSGE